jgi:hypothetical protein
LNPKLTNMFTRGMQVLNPNATCRTPAKANIAIFMYTTKWLCNIAAQYATSSEATEFLLPLGRREVTPSSGKEASSDVALHSAREGTKGGKRRCKQHLQGLRP